MCWNEPLYQQMHAINSLSPERQCRCSAILCKPDLGLNASSMGTDYVHAWQSRDRKTNLKAQGHTPHAHWVTEELYSGRRVWMILGRGCLKLSISSSAPELSWSLSHTCTTTLGVVGVPECSSYFSPRGINKKRDNEWSSGMNTQHLFIVCVKAPGPSLAMAQRRS